MDSDAGFFRDVARAELMLVRRGGELEKELHTEIRPSCRHCHRKRISASRWGLGVKAADIHF
jgi:hypothetical protein